MTDENQSFEELLSQARSDGQDGQLYWNIVWVLQKRADRETLDKAVALTHAQEFERSFAASILGGFGARIETPERPFAEEIIDRLLEMLAVEENENVISSLVSALGHQVENPRIPLALSQFVHHNDADLRWSMAVALGGYETSEAIESLVSLSRDEETDVRDWATFGLGNQCGLDTPAIRAALVERLDDEDEETRAEAIYGLAKRKDKRAVEAILKEFSAQFSGALLFDAMSETPDYRLLPALREMAASPEFPENDPDIRAAIAACEAHLEKQNEN